MIRMSDVRNNGRILPPIVSEVPWEEAFSRFTLYEIGYGGQVVDIQTWDSGGEEQALLKVQTRVLNCLDTLTLTGSLQEMKLLLQMAALSIKYSSTHGPTSDRTIDAIMEITKGSPLLIKMGMGIISGRQTLRNICIAMLSDDEAILSSEILQNAPMKDLVTVIAMVHNKECTLPEALQLLG